MEQLLQWMPLLFCWKSRPGLIKSKQRFSNLPNAHESLAGFMYIIVSEKDQANAAKSELQNEPRNIRGKLRLYRSESEG